MDFVTIQSVKPNGKTPVCTECSRYGMQTPELFHGDRNFSVTWRRFSVFSTATHFKSVCSNVPGFKVDYRSTPGHQGNLVFHILQRQKGKGDSYV